MRIAIIGGGAAGFFGAISAATHNKKNEIVLFEATKQPLDKVRISGGGRCNVTHSCFDPTELIKSYPRGQKELRGPFSQFQPKDTVNWFESHGVKLKTEADGRIFPITNKSSTIVDCLLSAASELGIEVRLGERIKDTLYTVNKKDEPSFEIESQSGKKERFDRLLIATGNSPIGYQFAEKLGHKIIKPVPSLFTFKITDKRLSDLSGISFNNVSVKLSIGKKVIEQSGPLLFTHWGLSGPAVLKLSAFGARELHDLKYKTNLHINFLPEYSSEKLYELLHDFKLKNGKKSVITESVLPVPKRYWVRIIQTVGITDNTTWSNITKIQMNAIVLEFTDSQFEIRGKGIFKEEFVTCGGVSLKEIDFKTMQSKICDGLYFAGEVLDIDGITGGFNFQSAWTTSFIAGKSIGS